MYDKELWKRLKFVSERCYIDDKFRKEMVAGNLEILRDELAQIDPDFNNASPLDPALVREAILTFRSEFRGDKPINENPYFRCITDYYADISKVVQERYAEANYANQAFARYNAVVTNRIHTECRIIKLHRNVNFLPIIFELGDGCSVQCPFCGIDAPLLHENFLYTTDNAALWREIVSIARDIIGPVVGMGVCYFATEPLDNPDYEKFVKDFREITGYVPQTTTAIPERYPERIRAYMQDLGSNEVQKAAIRFSIRSKSQYHQILKIYTPDELANIEFLPNNLESDTHYSYSGKVRRLYKPDNPKIMNYSISCLAGAKVNMFNKSIEWLEQERPSNEYPNGYRVCGKASFSDGDSFKSALISLIAQCAISEIIPEHELFINPYVRTETEGNVISFFGDGVVMRISGNKIFHDAIREIQSGITFESLCSKLKIHGFMAEDLKAKLTPLFKKGYIRQL